LRSFHSQRHLKRAIQIVPFRRRHLERILAIERASFGAQAWPRALFLDYYRDCRGFFWAAKVSGRIAGYIVTCVEKGVAEVASLAVHPDYRRRGVARALLRHTLRSLAAAGIRRAELAVRTDNQAGERLYRSFGFEQVRTVRRYYEDGTDAFRMARAIQ
jgi:ribosomal-protein-alanine N-acetyltransferase